MRSVEVIDLLTTNIVVDLFYSFYDSKVLFACVGSLVVSDKSLPVVFDVLGVEHERIILEPVLKPVIHSTLVVDRVAGPKLHQHFIKRHSLVGREHTCRTE